MEENAQLKALYLDAEHEDNYFRDQSVFSDGINIEDTLSVLVKYHNKVQLTYSLNAYLPWEGLNVVFNGTKGRIEMKIVEMSYVNAGDANFVALYLRLHFDFTVFDQLDDFLRQRGFNPRMQFSFNAVRFTAVIHLLRNFQRPAFNAAFS
jgi:hypothetical protein